jgi:hypothetical protein
MRILRGGGLNCRKWMLAVATAWLASIAGGGALFCAGGRGRQWQRENGWFRRVQNISVALPQRAPL